MKLGILGSGQLGAMLAQAARRLGVESVVFAPGPGPASAVARSEFAPWDDGTALDRFAGAVDLVTYEIEHVPLETVRRLEARLPVAPSVAALAALGDRARERTLLDDLGIPCAAWTTVEEARDVARVGDGVGWPCVLKRRTHGYDGRGQSVVRSPECFEAALASVGGPAIAERWIDWRREVSILAVRARDGACAWWDPVENRHEGGILRTSHAPAPGIDESDLATLRRWSERILARLDYVGVLAVELFETSTGWLVNELAPRVHNSGHWTIEGAETSQFENHVRALVGWPLGATATRGPTALVNLIGTPPPTAALLTVPGAALHLYGKPPRPGRKVGHVTVVAPDEAALAVRLAAVRSATAPSAAGPRATWPVARSPGAAALGNRPMLADPPESLPAEH